MSAASAAVQSDPAQPALTHPKYRPDIDGLRAIAVCAVVGFHAFPGWVKGGFVGVDIFFVISGFLISTIIFDSLERHSFSFAAFFGRRIRRIFPALLVVLAATLAFGWFALLADEYMHLGKHVTAGAGFASNYVLWSESGYFDVAAESKPLLHLWSLGIEEQFYIVWPLLLWVVWRWRLNLLTLTLLVLTVSFALNVGATRGNPLAAFYSPQARFWELLVGATLAHLTLHGNRRLVGLGLRLDRWLGSVVYAHAPEPNGQTLRDVLSATGTALIAMGLLLITKESQFPGWWAAMPTIGTALVITAGPRAWLNRTLYSNRVLVWFGLISFPLYLWHWPLLSFARILEGGEPSRGIRIMAVLVAIAAAWLTYVLVEKPVRNGRHAGSKTAVLAVLMVVAGFAGYATYRNGGLASRKANEPARMFAEVNDKALREVHFNEGVDRVNAECKKIIGPTSNGLYCQMMSPTPTILVVGDSHAVTFGYSATTAGYKDIAVVSANGCLPLMSHVSIERKVDFGVQVAICQGAINAALKIARETPSIRHVVLVGRGPLYITGQGFGIEAGTMNFSIRDIQGKGNPTNGEAFVAGHLETIAAFQKLGKKVVFAIDVPELGIDPKTCIDMRPLRLTRRPLPECAIPVDALDKRQASYRALVAEIVAKSPSVEVFDPKGALCDGQKCYGMRDGTIYYYDDDHLSKAGSALVFESFVKWLSARPQ